MWYVYRAVPHFSLAEVRVKPARYCGIPPKFATAFVAVMLMAVTGGAAAASAQSRMSDKDVESLM